VKNESFIDPNLSHYVNVRKRHKLVNLRRLAHAEKLFAQLPKQNAASWRVCLDIAWRDVN
jgi:hypothetical protein